MINKCNCDCNKYCNLNNRIIDHVNNNVIHVTESDKEAWNNKVSKDQLDQNTQDLQEKILDSSNAINDNLKSYQKASDMIKYSTLEYVDSEVLKLNKKYNQCVNIKLAEQLYNKLLSNDQKLSSVLNANYYTKKDIDDKITNKDYSITDLSINGNILSLTQSAVGQLSVKLPISNSEYDDQHVQELLKNYALLNNRKTITFKSGDNTVLYDPFGSTNRTISLDSSVNVGKYDIYYQNTTSNTIIPLVPASGTLPSEYASSAEEGKWNKICPTRNAVEYTWQVQVYINSVGIPEDWTSPICITSKDGENGVDTTGREYIYKVATNETYKNITTPTDSQDYDGFIPDGWTNSPTGVTESTQYEMFCYRDKTNSKWSEWKPSVPLVWSHFGVNGIDGDGFEYIYMATNGSIDLKDNIQNPQLWYDNTQSKLDVDKASYNKEQYILQNSGWVQDPIDLTQKGQGWKCYVSTRRRYADTGTTLVYWHQFTQPVLWSYYATDGVQELKGSPLRDRGDWNVGTTYYDGTISVDNIFYQDFVIYKNVYYACVDTQVGLSEAWQKTPNESKAFTQFSMNNAMFSDMLIANKANIKELSAGEIVITDGDDIVAGMTSSKAVNESSDLYNKVDTSGKGNVRIWAGQISGGQLNSAPFYVTNEGHMVSKSATLGSWKLKPGSLSYDYASDGVEPGMALYNDYLVFRKYKTNHLSNGSITYDKDCLVWLGEYLTVLGDSEPYKRSSLTIIDSTDPSDGGSKTDTMNVGIRLYVTGCDDNLQYDQYSNDILGNVPYGNFAIYADKGMFAGLRPVVRRIKANTTLSECDHTLSCVNVNEITLTLPSNPQRGQCYTIIQKGGKVNIHSTKNNLWAKPSGSTRYDGVADWNSNTYLQETHLLYDGGDWTITYFN